MDEIPQPVLRVVLNTDVLQLRTILTAALIDPSLAREVQSMNLTEKNGMNIDLGGLYGYSLKIRTVHILAKQAEKVSV